MEITVIRNNRAVRFSCAKGLMISNEGGPVSMGLGEEAKISLNPREKIVLTGAMEGDFYFESSEPINVKLFTY